MWRKRFKAEGWAGPHSRSRRLKNCPKRLPEAVQQSICQAGSELAAEAADGTRLCYVGPGAVLTRLAEKGIDGLPSTASIERVLRKAGMTLPRQEQEEEQVTYPRLHPTEPHQLCQVDIVPHYLKGGESVACFNPIDVVSRYPTGHDYERRHSQDAQAFLIHVRGRLGMYLGQYQLRSHY